MLSAAFATAASSSVETPSPSTPCSFRSGSMMNNNNAPTPLSFAQIAALQQQLSSDIISHSNLSMPSSSSQFNTAVQSNGASVDGMRDCPSAYQSHVLDACLRHYKEHQEFNNNNNNSNSVNHAYKSQQMLSAVPSPFSLFYGNTIRENASTDQIYGAVCRRRHTIVSNHPTFLSSPSPIPISPLPADKVEAAQDQQQQHQHIALLLSALIQQEQAQQRGLHTHQQEKYPHSAMTARIDNNEMIIPIVADSSLSAVEAASATAIMQNNELEVARRLATNHNLNSLAGFSPIAQLPLVMHSQFDEPKSSFMDIPSKVIPQQQFNSVKDLNTTEQSTHAHEILAAMIAAKTVYEKEISKWKWCEAASSATAYSQQLPSTSSTSNLLPPPRRKIAMANHQQTINLNDLQNDITSEHYHHQSSSFLLPHPMSLSAEKLDNSVNCCQMPSTSEQQQQQYSANIPYNYQKEQSKADQCQPYPHPCRLTATIDDQQRQRSKSLQSDFRRNSQQQYLQHLPTIINYLRPPAQAMESFLKPYQHSSPKLLTDGDLLSFPIPKNNHPSNPNVFIEEREKHFLLLTSDQKKPPNKAPIITLTDSPPPSSNNLISPFNCHQIPTPNNQTIEKGYKRPLSATTAESRNTSSVENVSDAGPMLWGAKNGAVDYGDHEYDEELSKMPRLLPECIMTFDTDDAENLAPPPQLDAFDDDVSGADDEDEDLLMVNEEGRTCTSASRKNDSVDSGAPMLSGDVSDGGLPPLLSAPTTPLSVVIDDVQDVTTGLKNSLSANDTDRIPACQKDRLLAQQQQQLPSPNDNDAGGGVAKATSASSAPSTECDYVKERSDIPSPPTSVVNRYSNVSASSDDSGVDSCGYYSTVSTRLPTVVEDLPPSSGVPMTISCSTAVVPVSTPLTLSVSSLSGGLSLRGVFPSAIPFPTPPPTSSSAFSADSIGSLSDFCGSMDNSLMLTPIENRRHTFPTVSGNSSLTKPSETISKWNSDEFTSLNNEETPKCAKPLSAFFGDAAQERRMKYASRKRHFEASSVEEEKSSIALITKDSRKEAPKSDSCGKSQCSVMGSVHLKEQRRVPPMKIVLTQREDCSLSNVENNLVKRKSKSPNLVMDTKLEKAGKFFPIFESKGRSATVSSPSYAKHVKKLANGDTSEVSITSCDDVKRDKIQKCKNLKEPVVSKRDVVTRRKSEDTDDEYDSILTISRRTKSFTINGTSSVGQCEKPFTSKHLLSPKPPSEHIPLRIQSHRNKRSSYKCRRKRKHHSGAEQSAVVDGRRHSTPSSSMIKSRKGAAQKTSKRGSLPVQDLTNVIGSGPKKSSKTSHDDRGSILRFVVPPERKSSRCAAMLLEKSSLTKESNLSLSKSSLENESNFGTLEFSPSKRRYTTSSSSSSVISRSPIAHLKFVSNWRPVGDGIVKPIRFINDSLPVKRRCFSAIRHWAEQDEVIRVRDCVKICSAEGFENIGKVMHLHYDEASKAIMATVLWFYTQVQVDTSKGLRVDEMHEKELLASRHIDTVNADCIESLAFVLTFNEYCRFVAETRIDQLPPFRRADECSELWSRGEHSYPRRSMLPHEDTPIELVYFCRGIYSLKTKKICLSLPTPLHNGSSGGASGLSNGLLTAENDNSASGCHRKSNTAKETVSEVKCAKEKGKRSLSKFC